MNKILVARKDALMFQPNHILFYAFRRRVTEVQGKELIWLLNKDPEVYLEPSRTSTMDVFAIIENKNR